jgi:hypothetical protein
MAQPGPMSRSLIHPGPQKSLREIAAARQTPSKRTPELAPLVLEALEAHGSIAVGDDHWHELVAALGVDGEEVYRALWNLTFAKRVTRSVDADEPGRMRWKFEIADGVS